MRLLLLIIFLCTHIYASAQQRFITVDNHQIWVNTIGIENRQEGQPVILFESGLGTPMDHWDRILEGVANLAPLVTLSTNNIFFTSHLPYK